MSSLAQLLDQADALARIIDLRMAQAAGELPPPGKVSQAIMAEVLGMSLSEYRRLENIILAKCGHALGNPAELLNLIPQEKTTIHQHHEH